MLERTLLAALAIGAALTALPAPARADPPWERGRGWDHDHGEWDRGDWDRREHGRWERERDRRLAWEREHRYYGRGYDAPPAYYAPPRAYYAPPAYEAPGVGVLRPVPLSAPMLRRIGAGLVLAALIGPAQAQAPAPVAAPAAAPVAATGDQGAIPDVERHIAGLKRRLGITPEQEPQWDAFAGVMRRNAERMRAGYADRAAKAATMNAVDDMRSYADLARSHAEDLQALVPAFEALYATMPPEQKAGADKTFQQLQARSQRRRAPGG